MPFWERAVIAAAAIVLAGVTAKLVDNALTRTALAPEAVTRYRVVRRVVMSTIVFIGVLSALLIIPQVRAIAGGILASSAVVGLVIGFAAQRTLGNAIAGILIAFSQPLRLGDRVMVDETEGTVEEMLEEFQAFHEVGCKKFSIRLIGKDADDFLNQASIFAEQIMPFISDS